MKGTEPFNNYPSQYEDWFERHKLVYESELRAIREQLPESGEGLEIGIGTGRFAAPLGIRIGIDPSSKMREIAQQRGLEVIDAKAESIPFDDSRFDFALMVTTICFLDDIEAAFKEAHRVLRGGGHFIIGFIDKDSHIGKLYQKKKNESLFYKFANFYSANEVVFHLKKTGFDNLKIVQTIFNDEKDMKDIEPVKEGLGEGSFVVIRAKKVRK